MSTEYSNLLEITKLQQKIVRFISYWVTTQKTPVPQKEIIEEMVRRGEKARTVESSLHGLLRLGYIRKSEIISNKTFYTQLRSI